MNKHLLSSIIMHCLIISLIFFNMPRFFIGKKNEKILPIDSAIIAEIVTKPTDIQQTQVVKKNENNNQKKQIVKSENKTNKSKLEQKKQTNNKEKQSVKKVENTQKDKNQKNNSTNQGTAKKEKDSQKIIKKNPKNEQIKQNTEENKDKKKTESNKLSNQQSLSKKTKEEKQKEFEKVMQTIKDSQLEKRKEEEIASKKDEKIIMELVQYIHSTFASCWNVPIITNEKKSYIVVAIIELEKNGEVKNVELKSQYDVDSIGNIVANSAIRAIHQCSPIANLPQDKYYLWQNIELTFNTEKMY